jgi:hypothetical protein
VPSPRLSEASPVPAKAVNEEEPLEQILERAMQRYRSIIEEGKGLSWGTDTEARLDRLEAFLKTLKEEAKRASPKPAADPGQGAKSAEKNSPVLPATGVLPAKPPSVGAVAATASLPVPPAVPSVPTPPAPVAVPPAVAPPSVLTRVPATPVASEPSPTPYTVARPLTKGPGNGDGPETALQLEQAASHCRALAEELQALADKLRKPAPAGSPESLSTFSR